MSSITLHVTYNNLTKKITCSRTTSINQVITQSLEKFKLEPSGHTGELFNSSNGKRVDPHLPIRLTNLLNNSKLKLEVKKLLSGASSSSILHLKVVVYALSNDLKSYVVKIASSSTVQKLLETLDEQHSVGFFEPGHYLQVTLLDSTIDNKSENGTFEKTTLNSVIGDGITSLAIRVNFKALSENTERVLEQNRINELQLQQQALRNHKRQEQEKLEREQRQQAEDEEMEVDEQKNAEINDATQIDATQIAAKLNENLVKLDEPKAENIAKQQELVSEDVSESSFVSEPFVSTPQLFVPSAKTTGRSSTYENPDEDYEVTVSQVQKYHKLITNSAKSTKPGVSKIAAPIDLFAIRLRFPDRSILQFALDDGANAKIGTLLKKIDSFVNPVYINDYSLKLGYPPFSKLETGFSQNGVLLRDHPAFTSSKTVLIWELAEGKAVSNEPYVKNIDAVKDSSELPEMVLEAHRGELGDEKDEKPPATPLQTTEKPKDAKKVPKWFRKK